MTRPAINAVENIGSTGWCQTPFYGSAVNNLVKSRLIRKDQSVKTTPRPRGNYTIPTNYSAAWGHCSIAPGASAYVPDWGPISWSSTSAFAQYNCDLRSHYSVPSWVQNALLIKALNDLRNNKFNAGLFLGQLGETSSMLTKTAARIAGTVTNFRRRFPKDWARIPKVGREGKAVPSGWLELQYGWNPLMSDLYGMCEALNSGAIRDHNTVTIKAKKKLDETVEYLEIARPGYMYMYDNIRVKSDCKVVLTYMIDSFKLALLSSLGLTNPLEIIWDRVPYSFVVDWFLPIGNWLSAMGGDLGYSFVSGYYSRYVTGVSVGTRYVASTSYSRAAGPSVEGRYGFFTRSVYTSAPWPGLYFKSPVSPTHIANALSLLAGAFRR